MKKLFFLALLPFMVACNKSSDIMVIPNATTQPTMKTSGGGNGGPANGTTYQLISFGVTKSSSNLQNHINWTAIGETNIIHYDLEISAINNYSWQLLTSVPSSNNNNSIARTYVKWANGGTTYFRLKIYHTNNTISYSPVKKVVWKDDIWNNF